VARYFNQLLGGFHIAWDIFQLPETFPKYLECFPTWLGRVLISWGVFPLAWVISHLLGANFFHLDCHSLSWAIQLVVGRFI
jgi:hypothetical protein